MGVDYVWLDELQAVLLKLGGNGGEVGQLVAARVDVRPEPGERQLLGERHAPYVVVALEDEHVQPRPRKVAGARQSVVPGAHNDGVIPRRHNPISRA